MNDSTCAKGWGPVIASDVDGSDLALAWTAHREGAVKLELLGLEQAETVDEGVAIAQGAGMPPQNFVVGDRNGNIAWTIAGRIPKREGGYDPRLPADWSQPGTGWNGWREPAEYPLLSNRRDMSCGRPTHACSTKARNSMPW